PAVPDALAAEKARRSLAEAVCALAARTWESAARAARRAASELDEPRAQTSGSPVMVLGRAAIPSGKLGPRALALAARAEERLGNRSDAALLIQKAREQAPNAPDILALAAEEQLGRGDLTAAKLVLE